MGTFVRYNLRWDDAERPLGIELHCIAKGGKWIQDGAECGVGMFEHLMNARKMIWPDRYRHRWTDLIHLEASRRSVVILMGSGSSQKTSHAAEHALMRYWASPHNTLVIVSTTTVGKLDMAIFGELKMLWESGHNRYPWLAGNPIEHKHAIATDDIKAGDLRDMRKGVVGLACYVGRQFVGLGTYAGIKQTNIVFIADELQFMSPTFLDCLPNMMQGSENLLVIGSGNPKHDPHDQLGKAAAPKGGWDLKSNVTKTDVWENEFHNGVTINLVGTDSPNFDFPEDQPTRYKGLISWRTVKAVEKRWGKDSLEYYKQCKGVMKIGMLGKRVLTREVCEAHHAFDKAIWKGSDQTRIGFLDPAWGGLNADRCIWGWLEFGLDLKDRTIIRFGEWMEIPILATSKTLPDDQIALFVQKQARTNGISPDNIFYGSTGRGTTGAAFARVFGSAVPVPIAEGDKPSQRPVRYDLYVMDNEGFKRHKRCDEEFARLNAELWFAVRNVVECEQFREFPEEVAREFAMREYLINHNSKIELEDKDEIRDRLGESPDLADAATFGIEGARQRGFPIGRLGHEIIDANGYDEGFDEEETEYRTAISERLLVHV